MKPRVFKDATGQWVVFTVDYPRVFLGVPLRANYRISRWATWGEAIQEANAKAFYETLRKDLT